MLLRQKGVSTSAGSAADPLVTSFIRGDNLQTVQPSGVNLFGAFTEAGQQQQEQIKAAEDNTLAEVLAELKALRTQVTTKADLANLRQDLLEATAELVATKLVPFQEER